MFSIGLGTREENRGKERDREGGSVRKEERERERGRGGKRKRGKEWTDLPVECGKITENFIGINRTRKEEKFR